jgi:hypothetical protein
MSKLSVISDKDMVTLLKKQRKRFYKEVYLDSNRASVSNTLSFLNCLPFSLTCRHVTTRLQKGFFLMTDMAEM